MDATEVLDYLRDRGIKVWSVGEDVAVSPASKVPSEVKAAIKQHKPRILARLRPLGDGQAPPLDRPPATEEELRRLIDHLVNPESFSRWMEWAMAYTDLAEIPSAKHWNTR